MSQQNPAIQKFVTDMNAQIARANQSITNINDDIARRNTDQETQKAKVAELQAALDAINSSPGTLSPEDQASLDAAIAAAKATADSLDATDAMTPIPEVPAPVPPVV